MTLIKDLLQLYTVDAQVRGLRSRMESARRYRDAQAAQLRTLEADRDEVELRKRHVQASIANLETEIKGIDERIEKLRDELNSASTNKQYAALLTELNTVKSNRSQIEDRVLQDMEQIEQLDAGLAELSEQAAERQKVRDVAEAKLKEREAEIGQRLSELESERVEAAAGIPGDCLAIFEEVADMHDGEAMAPIDEIDRRRREYACGACHMSMPFEQIAVLVSGGDTIVHCTACHRILHMQDETRGALAKK